MMAGRTVGSGKREDDSNEAITELGIYYIFKQQPTIQCKEKENRKLCERYSQSELNVLFGIHALLFWTTKSTDAHL